MPREGQTEINHSYRKETALQIFVDSFGPDAVLTKIVNVIEE
jgi:hypothetical protein